MPWSNKPGGPWGGDGGGKNGGGNNGGDRGPWGGGPSGGGGGGGGGQKPPDIDELLKKGQERLKGVFGGGGGGGVRRGSSGGGSGVSRAGILLAIAAVFVGWAGLSLYRIQPDEAGVVLTLGRYEKTAPPGLAVAIWPIQTIEVLPVTRENIIDIGSNTSSSRPSDRGLMLTGDENIVDIDFQVVWKIADPAKFLFNLSDHTATIQAVSESAMREVIGRSELSPILNRDRAIVSQDVRDLIQVTLDSYESGIFIERVNFDRADPPSQVIDAFRDVQAAAQDRVTEESRAEAYANQTLARARGEAAQMLQQAEGYRARVVNEAEGEAARFTSILKEYSQAPDVTRKRIYLETLEEVLGRTDKIIIDESTGGSSGSGVVPYLPLNELRRSGETDQ